MRSLMLAFLVVGACQNPAQTSSRTEQPTFDPPAASGSASSAPTAHSASRTSPAPANHVELGAGLRVERWSTTASVESNVVRIDLSRWELLSLPAARRDSVASSADTAEPSAPRYRLPAFAATRPGVRVAVNGGFFDTDGVPMGLRISRGQRWRPALKRDWGIFFVEHGRPNQVHSRDLARASSAEFAIQCGPRLVQDGAPLRLKPGLNRRTAIAAAPSGEVLLIATLNPIELTDFAAALTRPVTAGGLGLRHALNLDGGPSTQMFLPGQDSTWNIRGPAPVADAVVVVPRR